MRPDLKYRNASEACLAESRRQRVRNVIGGLVFWLSCILLGIGVIALLSGCEVRYEHCDDDKVSKEEFEAADLKVVASGTARGAIYMATLPDGTRCAVYTAGGIDCNWRK